MFTKANIDFYVKDWSTNKKFVFIEFKNVFKLLEFINFSKNGVAESTWDLKFFSKINHKVKKKLWENLIKLLLYKKIYHI